MRAFSTLPLQGNETPIASGSMPDRYVTISGLADHDVIVHVIVRAVVERVGCVRHVVRMAAVITQTVHSPGLAVRG